MWHILNAVFRVAQTTRPPPFFARERLDLQSIILEKKKGGRVVWDTWFKSYMLATGISGKSHFAIIGHYGTSFRVKGFQVDVAYMLGLHIGNILGTYKGNIPRV